MTGIPFDREALRRELDERPFRQRSGDGGQRPHWSVIAADERQYADQPELTPETETRGDWQDWVADTGFDEDRTLTDDLPPAFCPRYWKDGI